MTLIDPYHESVLKATQPPLILQPQPQPTATMPGWTPVTTIPRLAQPSTSPIIKGYTPPSLPAMGYQIGLTGISTPQQVSTVSSAIGSTIDITKMTLYPAFERMEAATKYVTSKLTAGFIKTPDIAKPIIQPLRQLGTGVIEGVASIPSWVISSALGAEIIAREPSASAKAIPIGLGLMAGGLVSQAEVDPLRTVGSFVGQSMALGALAPIKSVGMKGVSTGIEGISKQFPIEAGFIKGTIIDIRAQIPTKPEILTNVFGSPKPYTLELSAISKTVQSAKAEVIPIIPLISKEVFGTTKPLALEFSMIREGISTVKSHVPTKPKVLTSVFGSPRPYTTEINAITGTIKTAKQYIPTQPEILQSIFGSPRPYQFEKSIIKDISSSIKTHFGEITQPISSVKMSESSKQFWKQPTPESIQAQYKQYHPFETGRSLKSEPISIVEGKGFKPKWWKEPTPESIQYQYKQYDPFETTGRVLKSEPISIRVGEGYKPQWWKSYAKEYKPKELRDIFREIAGNTKKAEDIISTKYRVGEQGLTPKYISGEGITITDLSKSYTKITTSKPAIEVIDLTSLSKEALKPIAEIKKIIQHEPVMPRKIEEFSMEGIKIIDTLKSSKKDIGIGLRKKWIEKEKTTQEKLKSGEYTKHGRQIVIQKSKTMTRSKAMAALKSKYGMQWINLEKEVVQKPKLISRSKAMQILEQKYKTPTQKIKIIPVIIPTIQIQKMKYRTQQMQEQPLKPAIHIQQESKQQQKEKQKIIVPQINEIIQTQIPVQKQKPIQIIKPIEIIKQISQQKEKQKEKQISQQKPIEIIKPKLKTSKQLSDMFKKKRKGKRSFFRFREGAKIATIQELYKRRR